MAFIFYDKPLNALLVVPFNRVLIPFAAVLYVMRTCFVFLFVCLFYARVMYSILIAKQDSAALLYNYLCSLFRPTLELDICI